MTKLVDLSNHDADLPSQEVMVEREVLYYWELGSGMEPLVMHSAWAVAQVALGVTRGYH